MQNRVLAIYVLWVMVILPIQAQQGGTKVTFGGIGATITAERQTIMIRSVIPGSPAAKAGLHDGIRITRIDGVPTQNMSGDTFISKARGKIGTKVKLEVVDPEDNKTNTVVLTRVQIEVPVLVPPPPPKKKPPVIL